MRVTVTLEVVYDLPEPLAEIYGATDPAECVNIDLEADAPAFFDNADAIKILSVSALLEDVNRP